MGITIKLHRPGADPTPPEPPVKEVVPQLTETEVTLQELLPEKCRVPLPEPVITKEPPALVVNYPRSGKRVLPAGTTRIDIKQMNVLLPDDTVEEMYTTRKVDSCRCFALYTDRMLDIRISRHGALLVTSSVFPAWIRKLDMPEFDMIEIECTEPTTIYISMSEMPDGVPEYHPERWLSPPSWLGYNAADDLVEMKKVINGVTHTRLIDDPDVPIKTVVKWIEYGSWIPT